VFDPGLVRTIDRAARLLRSFPEIRQANSLADYVRKTHLVMAGPGGDGLPTSRALVAQEVMAFDDGRMLRDTLSRDRRKLAAFGYSIDVDSNRAAAMFRDIDAWIAREQAALDAREDAPRARIHATGQLRIFKDVNDSLLEGLVGSFGGAILISLVVFGLALRSWRLALIALVPNVSPIVLVVALMALLGIDLKPATVVLFSITLVIADDDTIQYLSRFRSQFRAAKAKGEADPHQAAALACLHEVGLPMFVTSTTVSLGFLLLLFSGFLGLANLGLLIGATLFVAVFADLYLTPVLLMKLRPRID
jgi:predicted RND superfamily exporter protein